MSRLGKLPIELKGVQASVQDGFISVKGPKGDLKQALPHDSVKIDINEKEIKVSVKDSSVKDQRALWGLYRSLIKNMVQGVSEGYTRKLEINGVGYRAAIAGSKLTLNVGYSHPVEFVFPEGVSGKVEGNVITLIGFDKQLLGETAARIRRVRKPEPYKGKGIKYAEEVIIRKAGKTATKGA